jgi:hypothetical protein
MKNSEWLEELRSELESGAKKARLIKGTIEWKMRWISNCATELNSDKQTKKKCFAIPSSHAGNASFSVCDITEGVMRHVDESAD